MEVHKDVVLGNIDDFDSSMNFVGHRNVQSPIENIGIVEDGSVVDHEVGNNNCEDVMVEVLGFNVFVDGVCNSEGGAHSDEEEGEMVVEAGLEREKQSCDEVTDLPLREVGNNNGTEDSMVLGSDVFVDGVCNSEGGPHSDEEEREMVVEAGLERACDEVTDLPLREVGNNNETEDSMVVDQMLSEETGPIHFEPRCTETLIVQEEVENDGTSLHKVEYLIEGTYMESVDGISCAQTPIVQEEVENDGTSSHKVEYLVEGTCIESVDGTSCAQTQIIQEEIENTGTSSDKVEYLVDGTNIESVDGTSCAQTQIDQEEVGNAGRSLYKDKYLVEETYIKSVDGATHDKTQIVQVEVHSAGTNSHEVKFVVEETYIESVDEGVNSVLDEKLTQEASTAETIAEDVLNIKDEVPIDASNNVITGADNDPISLAEKDVFNEVGEIEEEVIELENEVLKVDSSSGNPACPYNDQNLQMNTDVLGDLEASDVLPSMREVAIVEVKEASNEVEVPQCNDLERTDDVEVKSDINFSLEVTQNFDTCEITIGDHTKNEVNIVTSNAILDTSIEVVCSDQESINFLDTDHIVSKTAGIGDETDALGESFKENTNVKGEREDGIDEIAVGHKIQNQVIGNDKYALDTYQSMDQQASDMVISHEEENLAILHENDNLAISHEEENSVISHEENNLVNSYEENNLDISQGEDKLLISHDSNGQVLVIEPGGQERAANEQTIDTGERDIHVGQEIEAEEKATEIKPIEEEIVISAENEDECSAELASTSGGKRRREFESFDNDSLAQERKKITLPNTTISPAPRQSFKIGDCISRVASQLTMKSPSNHKGNAEIFQKLDLTNQRSVGAQGFEDSAIQKMTIPAPDEMLPQLHLVAQDPMNGFSFLNTIITFFSNFRNTVIPGQYSTRGSMDNVGSGGRKKKSLVGYPETFEFEDMKDSYWIDRVIQNGTEDQQPQRQNKRDYQLVTLEPASTPKVYSRKKSNNNCNHKVAKDRQLRSLDENERKRSDLSSAELIMTFPRSGVVPSEINLNKMFRRFGPLKESETEVDRDTSRARVIFKRCSEAEVALSSCERFNVFGKMPVNYQLNYSPSVPFKAPCIATHEDLEAAIAQDMEMAANEYLDDVSIQYLEDGNTQYLEDGTAQYLDDTPMHELDIEITHITDNVSSYNMDITNTQYEEDKVALSMIIPSPKLGVAEEQNPEEMSAMKVGSPNLEGNEKSREIQGGAVGDEA